MDNQPITTTLNARGDRYGDFKSQALLSAMLYQTWQRHYHNHSSHHKPLEPFIDESLKMIFHKLARLGNGDPLYIDNWRDIIGYAQLVIDVLQETDGATDATVSVTRLFNGEWNPV